VAEKAQTQTKNSSITTFWRYLWIYFI